MLLMSDCLGASTKPWKMLSRQWGQRTGLLRKAGDLNIRGKFLAMRRLPVRVTEDIRIGIGVKGEAIGTI